MEELHPILSFLVVLASLAVCCLVIYFGGTKLLLSDASSGSEDSEAEVSADRSSGRITARLRTSGGALLVISGLAGMVVIVYFYWAYALPLLLLGGGAGTAMYRQSQLEKRI